MEFNPPFIDVTYHREEYTYKELPNGLLEKKLFVNVQEPSGFVQRFKTNIGDAIPHIYAEDLIKKTRKTF